MPADNPINDLALAAIEANAQAKVLQRSGTELDQIPFSTLYAYVNDSQFRPPTNFSAQIDADEKAQQNLDLLLEKASLAHMPMLAAASSGDTILRETDAAIIRLTPSKAEPEQVYLQVQMKDAGASMPLRLFVRKSGEQWIRMDLSKFVDAKVQELLLVNDPVTQALNAPDSEVYLR